MMLSLKEGLVRAASAPAEPAGIVPLVEPGMEALLRMYLEPTPKVRDAIHHRLSG
jgi:hypothetical protein